MGIVIRPFFMIRSVKNRRFPLQCLYNLKKYNKKYMKRGIFATLTSRVVMVCMLAMMLPVFNSCNKESADAA